MRQNFKMSIENVLLFSLTLNNNTFIIKFLIYCVCLNYTRDIKPQTINLYVILEISHSTHGY